MIFALTIALLQTATQSEDRRLLCVLHTRLHFNVCALFTLSKPQLFKSLPHNLPYPARPPDFHLSRLDFSYLLTRSVSTAVVSVSALTSHQQFVIVDVFVQTASQRSRPCFCGASRQTYMHVRSLLANRPTAPADREL